MTSSQKVYFDKSVFIVSRFLNMIASVGSHENKYMNLFSVAIFLFIKEIYYFCFSLNSARCFRKFSIRFVKMVLFNNC